MTNLKLKLQAIAISASLVSAIPASAQISMSATAIGNMISVDIEGNNNTVMVDASQISTGNQTAIVAHLPTSGSD